MYNRSSSHEELLSELAKQNDLWLHCKTEPDKLLVVGAGHRHEIVHGGGARG